MTRRMFFPMLVGIVGTAILASLGIWQLQRLEWKLGVLADIGARIGGDPMPLPGKIEPERDRYRPVTASGTITDAEINVLVSVRGTGPGYRIVAAFETDAGRRILLDRGFVAEASRGELRPPVMATVTGNLHWPDEIDRFTPEPNLDRNIWFARDVPAMAAVLETEPVMIVLRTSSESEPPATPMPVDTAGIPNDHLGYAVTWFGLAAVWTGMTLFLVWRIRQRTV